MLLLQEGEEDGGGECACGGDDELGVIAQSGAHSSGEECVSEWCARAAPCEKPSTPSKGEFSLAAVSQAWCSECRLKPGATSAG